MSTDDIIARMLRANAATGSPKPPKTTRARGAGSGGATSQRANGQRKTSNKSRRQMDKKTAGKLLTDAITSRKEKPTPEQAILLRMVAADRASRKAPEPPKRRQPKVTRMVSSRQSRALSGTQNNIRAIYQTAEQAARSVTTSSQGNEGYTRNVGPLDFGLNYCHGKETENRR
jgi:hypothetical protein